MTTYTTSLRLWQGTPGDPAIKDVWGVFLNTNATLIDSATNGVSVVPIGGQTAVTLSVANGAADQAREAVLQFTGALTAACTVTLPNVPRVGYVINQTTGGFAVILTTGAGTTASVPADSLWHLYNCASGNVTLPLFSTGTTALSGSSLLVSGNARVTGSVTAGSATVNGAAVVTDNGGTYGINISGNAANLSGAPVVRANGQTYGISISGLAAAASSVPWTGVTGKPYQFNQSVDQFASPSFANVLLSGQLTVGNALNLNTTTINPASNAVVVSSVPNPASGFVCFVGNIANASSFFAAWLFGGASAGSISLTPGGGVAYNSVSDQRLKIDVTAQESPKARSRAASSIIARLRPRWFVWKKNPKGKPEIGFFAQEVHKVFPPAVTPGEGVMGHKDFVPWQMDPAKLIPVMVAELQALRREMDELQLRVGYEEG